MFGRIAKIGSLMIVASLTLTACDPPMPPEVRAALAEQSYTCVEGDTRLSAPPAISAVATDWQDSVSTNCVGMSITPAAKPDKNVELQIGEIDKTCQAYLSVPFAVDAVVLAVQLTDISQVNLSADAISKIASGEIAAWNDPEIAKLNSSFDMPSTPIKITSELSGAQVKSLTDWLSRSAKKNIELQLTAGKLSDISEGQLVLTSYSAAMSASLPMVSIDTVVPEIGSISSAASMFKVSKDATGVATSFDAKAKPIAPEGVDVAPQPYQAVDLIPLNLCGADSLKTRAAARYILRQDSQGSLGLSTVVALPENLRLESLVSVSKGLPEPEITEPAE